MSKETTHAHHCPGCGRRFAFLGYHLPHCKKLISPEAASANLQEEKPTKRRKRKKKGVKHVTS